MWRNPVCACNKVANINVSFMNCVEDILSGFDRQNKDTTVCTGQYLLVVVNFVFMLII